MSTENVGEVLVRRNVISRRQLNVAQQMAQESNSSIVNSLLTLDYTLSETVARVVAELHNMEFVDLSQIEISDEVVKIVPESVVRENVVMPLAEENDTLKVAITDPFAIEAMDTLRFISNGKVETAVAPRKSILEAIDRCYKKTARSKVGCCTNNDVNRDEKNSSDLEEVFFKCFYWVCGIASVSLLLFALILNPEDNATSRHAQDSHPSNIKKYVLSGSKVMTEEYRRAVTNQMIKQGTDPVEADATTKALNDAQREWEHSR